jgi:hypothetical protein
VPAIGIKVDGNAARVDVERSRFRPEVELRFKDIEGGDVFYAALSDDAALALAIVLGSILQGGFKGFSGLTTSGGTATDSGDNA